MINFLVIVFIISLLYMAKNEALNQYTFILGIQGIILFVIAIFELKEIDLPHLLLILVETLLFKAIFIPRFLKRLAARSKFRRNHKGLLPVNASIFIAIVIVSVSFAIAHELHDEHLEIKYFTAAVAALGIGFYTAINHKDIFTHLVSFIILENGIFLLALSMGSEMPMLINAAVLLDIFSTFLIMGIFFNRVQAYFDGAQTDHLTQLKD